MIEEIPLNTHADADRTNRPVEPGICVVSPIQQLNQKVAQKINDEVLANPQSPYAGKFIGLVNGEVVVVADSWNDLGRKLRQAKCDQATTFGFEAGVDERAVEEIWEAI